MSNQSSISDYNDYYSYPQALFNSFDSTDESSTSQSSERESIASTSFTSDSSSSCCTPKKQLRRRKKPKRKECAECIRNCVECQLERAARKQAGPQSNSLQYALINQLISITEQRTRQLELDTLTIKSS